MDVERNVVEHGAIAEFSDEIVDFDDSCLRSCAHAAEKENSGQNCVRH